MKQFYIELWQILNMCAWYGIYSTETLRSCMASHNNSWYQPLLLHSTHLLTHTPTSTTQVRNHERGHTHTGTHTHLYHNEEP